MNSYPRPLPFAPNIRRVEIPSHVVTIACCWEVVGIVTGWVPTFTSLTRRHKVLAFLLAVAVTVHLVHTPVVVVVGT